MAKYNKLWASIIMTGVFMLGMYYDVLPKGFDAMYMAVIQGALVSFGVLMGPSNK